MKMMVAVILLGTVLVGLAVTALVDGGNPEDGDLLLPDLWSSAPFELQLATLEGRDVIRFTTEINNQGAGAFILRGNTRSGDFAQWIARTGTGHLVQPVDVEIVWGGDTHFHWHVAEVARYWIEPLGGRTLTEGFDNKVGFCFFDGVDRVTGRPDAPTEAIHQEAGCGSRLDPDLAMGLSVGWGDQYRFDLVGQFIDIDDLPPGRYRLVAQVDPDARFVEADATNNISSTDFTLTVGSSGNKELGT